jgi:hypothetical protein
MTKQNQRFKFRIGDVVNSRNANENAYYGDMIVTRNRVAKSIAFSDAKMVDVDYNRSGSIVTFNEYELILNVVETRKARIKKLLIQWQ